MTPSHPVFPRLLLVAAALAAGSCAVGGPGVPYDPGDPEQQAQIRLVLLEPSPEDPNLRLGYEATGRIRVRVELEDGRPVEGAPVRFEVPPSADPRDTVLSTTEALSDEDGVAEVTVRAGTQPTGFAVQPTFRMQRLTVTVAVFDTDKGRIKASLRYAGTQPLSDIRGVLLRGYRCADLTPGALPEPVQNAPAVRSLRASISFVNLDPATDYAVFVMAYLDGDVFAAYGCTDSVAVMARNETLVDVSLQDVELPARFEGVYDLFNRLDFGRALPGGVASGVAILAELYDDDALEGNPAEDKWGQDPGAFVVDLAMRQTCAWRCMPGEDYGSCSNLDHGYGDLRLFYTQNFQRWDGAQSRFFGGCGAWAVRWSGRTAAEHAQVWINDQIRAYVPETVRRFFQTASDIAGVVNDARIVSVLTLSPGHARSTVPFRHELVRMEVTVHDLGGMPREINFELREAGLSSVLATGTATAEANRLSIPRHEFRLHYGRLFAYIWKRVLELYGFASTAELLATWIDCDVIARELAARENVIDLSEDTYRDACNNGIAAAGRFVEDRIASSGGETSIFLRGTVIGTDITPDDLVQRLTMGRWEGTWGEEGMTDEITGTFRGQLRGTPPTMGGM